VDPDVAFLIDLTGVREGPRRRDTKDGGPADFSRRREKEKKFSGKKGFLLSSRPEKRIGGKSTKGLGGKF